MNEFEAIRALSGLLPPTPPEVLVPIGDDCAVFRIGDKDWVAASDMLVSGRHFGDWASPADVGYKAVAVNVSDVAAMGATPAWATLALTLPELDVYAVYNAYMSHFGSPAIDELLRGVRLDVLALYALANPHRAGASPNEIVTGICFQGKKLHGFLAKGVVASLHIKARVTNLRVAIIRGDIMVAKAGLKLNTLF